MRWIRDYRSIPVLVCQIPNKCSIDTSIMMGYDERHKQFYCHTSWREEMRKEASVRKSGSTYETASRSASSPSPRERVRPVRRRRKRSVWRKTILPLLMFGCVIAAVVFVYGRISRPFMIYDKETQATRELQKKVNDYRAENAALTRRIQYLKTPEGAAQAARELGWVKPGEITLVIPANSKPKK